MSKQMPLIKIKEKSVYGRQSFYPDNDFALMLVEFKSPKAKILTESELTSFRRWGFPLEMTGLDGEVTRYEGL